MEWLSQNWIWVLVLAAFVAMHLFAHGGHGGHGGRGGHCGRGDRPPTDGEQSGKDRPQGHRH